MVEEENQRCSYQIIFGELQNEEERDFNYYMRMPPHMFHFVLQRIEGLISKEETPFGETISAGARLEGTLLWLANEGSYT